MTYLVVLSNRMDLNEGRCCEVSVQGSFCLSMKVLFIVQDGLNVGLGPAVLSFVTTQRKNQRKSLRPPIPTTARPVVPEKCLPRIQAIFPSLPLGKTGLPLHPPWRTAHTPRALHCFHVCIHGNSVW